jgi:hypothetical protein
MKRFSLGLPTEVSKHTCCNVVLACIIPIKSVCLPVVIPGLFAKLTGGDAILGESGFDHASMRCAAYQHPLPTTTRYLLLPATYYYPLPTTTRYLLLPATYYYPLPTTTRYVLLPATYYYPLPAGSS